jgi:DNA polymerase III subunit delta'
MNLSSIIGNRHLVDLVRRRPLPPAALFFGPDGIGKKKVALALAALSNCRQPRDLDLCGICSSCIKALAGNHPDISLYLPEKNAIKIETMRELSREAHYRPFEGKARFFIVDEAERMTEEAANSLLKTLEEPPPSSHLILITAFPERLLKTIRSRCQAFGFQSLTRGEIAACLTEAGRVENVQLRAAFSDGSIGRALSLDLPFLLKDRDAMLDLLQAWLSSRSFETIFRRAESSPFKSDLKSRERVKNYLALLQSLGEDLYFILVGTPERVVSFDRQADLEKIAAQVSLDWVRNLLYHIHQSQWDVEHYVGPLMCFETLWLRAGRGSLYV